MTVIAQRGKSFPLGATVYPSGVNFSVYSKSATGVQLLLFNRADDEAPDRTIQLSANSNRTGDYWHVFVPECQSGQVYGYRVDGPFDPEAGHRYDPNKVLLDPYGKCVSAHNYSRTLASNPGDNVAACMKSVVADSRLYDWEGDMPLNRPFAETIIYEVHVAGFTGHVSSDVSPEKRGSYSGLVEKIPYLQDLGITAVELLPIFQFDPQDAPAGLSNYWGYSPVSFFAPHIGYSSWSDPLKCLQEFKDMVKALHRAGIEVILDAVYNHTTEGSTAGPTLCYRGFENGAYYTLDESSQARYADYTGCGNTLNANHSVVRRMILDSVHYWVSAMHVDGIRFDLASILSRDESGRPMANAPILSDLESDPVLSGTKLIAEAWDIQLYQVGNFARGNWKEWNRKFRDHVRSFLKTDQGTLGGFANRILGSPDIYGHQRVDSEKSINFVTCHDGFTLNDLASYNEKNNEANGEENRDGSDNNLSWNCGAEGVTQDSVIEEVRNRQVKNFLAVTLLAAGTPMILMGDEIRRTQQGNNNAYCQDNEIAWFDWSLLEKHEDVFRFVRHLTRLRARLYNGKNNQPVSVARLFARAGMQWHGVRLKEPDWGENSHSIAFTVKGDRRGRLFHFMINEYWEPLEFELPPTDAGNSWRRLIDTSLPSPSDIIKPRHAPPVATRVYRVHPRSVALLYSARKLIRCRVPGEEALPPG